MKLSTKITIAVGILIFGIIVISLLIARPQSENHWRLLQINTDTGVVLGYSYDSPPLALNNENRQDVKLKMICPIPQSNSMIELAPILALSIYPALIGNKDVKVSILLDDKIFKMDDDIWIHENTLIYREIYRSKKLIEAMKDSKVITFDFDTETNEHWKINFELGDFKSRLENIKPFCGN